MFGLISHQAPPRLGSCDFHKMWLTGLSALLGKNLDYLNFAQISDNMLGWLLRARHDKIGLFQLQPKVLTSQERADLEAYVQDPPAEFTVPWHSGVEDHNMALHRCNYDLSQGAMFQMSCSCGWQSEPSNLEIDACACSALHVKEVRRQKDEYLVLRFREHILSLFSSRNPRSLNVNEERWVGLCACGWSYVERTEDDAHDAFENH